MKKPRGVPSTYGWVSASVYNSCWRIFARQVGVANSTGVMIFRFTRHDKYIYWPSFSGTVYIVDDAAFKPSKCLATTPITLDRIPPQKKKKHTHTYYSDNRAVKRIRTHYFFPTLFFFANVRQTLLLAVVVVLCFLCPLRWLYVVLTDLPF